MTAIDIGHVIWLLLLIASGGLVVWAASAARAQFEGEDPGDKWRLLFLGSLSRVRASPAVLSACLRSRASLLLFIGMLWIPPLVIRSLPSQVPAKGTESAVSDDSLAGLGELLQSARFLPVEALDEVAIVVDGVLRDGEADRLGLQSGDRILLVEGSPMESRIEAFDAISRLARLEVEVLVVERRDGTTATIPIRSVR